MSRIAQVSIENFLCFKGTHVLDLEAKSYAVMAQRDTDPDSSNWAGKSSFLKAIGNFVLYGQHDKRTEDEWITHGEPSGEVLVVFDNGARIRRSRTRGKRTSLHFEHNGVKATQDEAQILVNKLLGMGAEDFANTCYFAQKQMSRFVTVKAADRMDIVSEWFRLGPLEKCEDGAGDVVGELMGNLAALDEQRLRLAAKVVPDPAVLVSEIEMLAQVVERGRGLVARLQDEVGSNATLLSAKAKVEDFDALYAEGKALRELVDSKGDLASLRKAAEALGKDEAAVAAALATATKHRREREQLARGKFDGHCPVMAAPCPAADVVTKACKKNQDLVDEAVKAEGGKRVELAVLEEKANQARAQAQEVERLNLRLEQMRRQAEAMLEEVERARSSPPAQDPQALRARLDQAQGQLQEAVAAHARAKGALIDHEGVQAGLKALEGQREAVAGKLAVWREAQAVFKAAQKKVAEASLAEIEGGANRTLAKCGVDLSVSMPWSREGSGIAKTCEQCGAPFPASAKVKACQRCQAPRGALMVNKLELVLSDRSGAAEDLVGASVQLAASAWLRAERGCGWSVALLDEPFGALDKSNRRAFGSHLASMLTEYGFEQSFVVAHHPDVLGALPGRILITSSGGSSRIEVVC